MNQIPKKAVFANYDSGRHVQSKILDKVNISPDLMVLPKYEPKAGDKLYFFQGTSVPRFKMKQFCKKYNVSIVRNPAKSNIKIIGSETVSNIITETQYKYPVNIKSYIAWLEGLGEETITKENVKNLLHDASMSETGICYVDYSIVKQMYNEIPSSTQVLVVHDVEMYNLLSKSQVYSQDEILNKLNVDIIMDEELFKSVKEMFKSPDIENVKVAMEIMANCNYERSASYLVHLLMLGAQRISESKVSNHVNFKSLLKYFSLGYLGNINSDVIIQSLIRKRLLNIDNLQYIVDKIAIPEVSRGNTVHFKVESLQFSEEIQEGLRTNILDDILKKEKEKNLGNPDPEVNEENTNLKRDESLNALVNALK